MSLLVRLPLNGNLNNYGSADVTVTVTGTTSYGDGRYSKALSCNGSSYWTVTGVTLGSEASIACWSKTSTNGKMSWVLVSSVSDKLNLYESSQYCLNTGDGNSNLFKDGSGNAINCLHDNQWHHFVVTFGSNVAKLYIDGVYRGTATTFKSPATTSAKTIKLAGGYNNGHSYDWNGLISDFRVYDECLSESEIKHFIRGKGLQIWLPLNGDLTQQGLSNASITNVGATVDNSGKIGKCYSFDGSDDGIRIDGDILPQLQKGDFSICFWAYSNDAGDRSIYIATTPASDWGFSIEKTTGNKLRVYWQGNPDFNTTLDVPNQQWCHIAVVIKNGNCYCYKNGEKLAERTSGDMTPDRLSRTWIYAQLGRDTRTGSTVLNGKMNDFRWYDYALSEKKVKELSKGLVLHYLLNRGGLGQENLGVGTNQGVNKWSNSRANGTYSLESVKWLGVDAVKMNCEVASTSWKMFTHNGFLTNWDKYVAGGTYTLSYDTSGEVPVTLSGLMDSNALNDVVQSKTLISNTISSNKQHYEYRIVLKNPLTKSSQLFYFANNLTANTSVRIANLKFEEGSIATPWCPNSSDTLATTMGLNGTTEYDCSGFCNNGTRTGTFSWTSDTPKYQVSTHIGATNQKIHISNFPTSGFGDSYSFAWWGKRNSNSPMFWGFSDGIRLNGMYGGTLWNTGDSSNNPIYKPGTTTKITAPSVDVWHHYVMTGDGTTCKLYLDGELYGQAKTYKAISGTSIWINGWDSGTQYCSDNTDISDFRIYATALSADDIAELYNGGVL